MAENIGRAWGEPVFEIAVYRVTPERWHEELGQLDQQAHAALDPHRDYLPQASYQNHFIRLQDTLRSQAGHFPYGQAIGWLRLIHDGPGPVIKGYGYKLPQSRIYKRFHQTHFRETGKEIEVSLSPSEPSREFVKQLRAAIISTTCRRRVFHRRWLDMSAFDKTAPHVDWWELLSPPR